MCPETLNDADQNVRAAREGLLARLSAIESSVVGTVEDAHDAVTHVTSTVHDATDRIRGLLDQGADVLQETLDVSAKIRSHPLVSVGVAAVAGALVGLLSRPLTRQVSTVVEKGAPASELMETVRRELTTIGERFIVAASQALQGQMDQMAAAIAPEAAGPLPAQRPRHERYVHRTNGHHAVI